MRHLFCTAITATSLLAFASMARANNVPFTHGSRAVRTVCLTFDACQTHKVSGYDSAIVRVLERTHTPASFMLGGAWMVSHPAAVRHLAANPQFEIGSHSYWHPHMKQLTPAEKRTELVQTQNTMAQLTGRSGHWFRPPYGEYNPELLAVASSLGLHTVTWEVVTGDPDRRVTAARMTEAVLHRTKPGSVIIMHVNGRGWHTAEALPNIIRGLKKRGFKFVTLSQELSLSRPN